MVKTIISREEVRGNTKKRPKLYGWIFRYDDGTAMYVAKRKHCQIFKGGCSSISDAILEDKAGWAIDELTIFNMRVKGVTVIAVKCEDNGDKYVTPIENYLQRGKFRHIDYTGVGKGGSLQRVVPLSSFQKIAGEVTVKGRAK